MRTALILGVTGQTGAYLAQKLVSRNLRVIGSSRNYTEANLWRLQRLGVDKQIEYISLSLHDAAAIQKTLKTYHPEEIYYLAGPSSVAASFREPMVAMDQIFQPIVSFLETLKESNSSAHFINAASTDCFGNQPGIVLDETSALKPLSPYAVAKSAALWTVRNYRDSFGVRASNGILTNHESPLRGSEFVTQKIITGLRDIADGKNTHLLWVQLRFHETGYGQVMLPTHFQLWREPPSQETLSSLLAKVPRFKSSSDWLAAS